MARLRDGWRGRMTEGWEMGVKGGSPDTCGECGGARDGQAEGRMGRLSRIGCGSAGWGEK